MKNRLSVITVNLNNAEGLTKTIESVSRQQNIIYEYIVIDGGSDDGSVDIIKEYAQKFNGNDNAYCWISEKDTGVYNAMNKGIKKANGEYLLFLNSGDFFVDESVLKNVFSVYHIADFLCGKSNITQNGSIVHTTNPPDIHTFSTYFNASINHQSTFIKKSVFERYGHYREDFKYNSDWEFWIRTIILNNCTTQKINTVICDYNLEGISSKENTSWQYNMEIQEVLSNPLLQKFVPDYEKWEKTKEDMKVMYWIKRKPILYKPLIMLYNIAKVFTSKK